MVAGSADPWTSAKVCTISACLLLTFVVLPVDNLESASLGGKI